MSRIYRQCTLVISWPDYNTDSYQAARDFHVSCYTSAEALIELLRNRYFTRLWIVQEALLAQKVMVLCGNIWLSFADMYECTRANQEIVHDKVLNSSLYLLWDCVHNREGRNLASCIDRYSLNECQDPRDKIYALLGLVTEEETAHLDVNYAKSVEQVYVDAIRVFVKSFWRKRFQGDSEKWSPYVEILLNLAKRMSISLVSVAEKATYEYFLEAGEVEPDDTWYATFWWHQSPIRLDLSLSRIIVDYIRTQE
jgi:hypothetical protein